jgi:hypothetical protein
MAKHVVGTALGYTIVFGIQDKYDKDKDKYGKKIIYR